MARKLRMKCPICGHWNRVPVDKAFLEQPSPESREVRTRHVRQIFYVLKDLVFAVFWSRLLELLREPAFSKSFIYDGVRRNYEGS